MLDKYSKTQLHTLSLAELEKLIQSMSADVDSDYWMMVMDEYTSRGEIQAVDVEAAFDDFKANYSDTIPVLSETGDVKPLTSNSPQRRLPTVLRVILVAAILMTLFTATAYAAGWFGLRSRSVKTDIEVDTATFTEDGKWVEEKTDAVLLIPTGYQDSAEYLAAAEWYEFNLRYSEEKSKECENAGLELLDWLDDEGAKAVLGESQGIYHASDTVLAEKLLDICQKYGVKLHTAMAFPDSLSAFYQLSGTEPFGIQKENNMASAYVFEDGSFTVQGGFEINGDACLYSLQRNLSGTLPPYMSRIKAPDTYEEWDYTTASGAYVCIDWCRDADWPYFPNIDNTGELKFGHTVYIHYTQDDAFITLWGYVPAGKEDAEAFADMFDFAKACSGRSISS